MPNFNNICLKSKIKRPALRLNMGGADSKPMNGDQPEDGQFHTPIANRHVQKLTDPRSPTDDVSRTPLQRTIDDSFEDPRSPTTVARTPVPDDSDPRSPSGGREPGPFVFPLPMEDPRSPSRIIARTPVTKDAPHESSIESVTVHQAEHEESSENTSNNNDCDNDDVVHDIANPSVEDTESGVFQIETDNAKLVGNDGDQSQGCDSEGKNELKRENTPEYEMELTQMVERHTIANEEAEGQDRATLVLSDRETIFLTELPPTPASSRDTKKPSIRRSLKEKFQSSSHQRSPLSTRNLLRDSPDPTHRAVATHKVGVAYQKAGMRTRLTDREGMHPVRVVGRYQPVVDKENY